MQLLFLYYNLTFNLHEFIGLFYSIYTTLPSSVYRLVVFLGYFGFLDLNLKNQKTIKKTIKTKENKFLILKNIGFFHPWKNWRAASSCVSAGTAWCRLVGRSRSSRTSSNSSNFHHGRARKTRHLVHSQKTITYLLLPTKQRVKNKNAPLLFYASLMTSILQLMTTK